MKSAPFLLCFLISLVPCLAQDLVSPTKSGLKSNHNYYLYNDGKPIMGLVVTLEITQDVVCDEIGFHVQLNANSPLGSGTHWQQYVMGFKPDFQHIEPIVGCSIEYFAKPNSFDTGQKFPHHNPVNLQDSHTLPAGAKFVIAIQYDGANVSGAQFTYYEKNGKNQNGWIIAVPPPTPPYPGPPLPLSVRAPIVAFQVDIVGANNRNHAEMKSGAGTITYSSTSPMTVVARKPPSEGAITGETANSVYGQLPAGPSNTFTQTFSVGM